MAQEGFTYEEDKTQLPEVCSLSQEETIERDKAITTYQKESQVLHCDTKCKWTIESDLSRLHNEFQAEKDITKLPILSEEASKEVKDRAVMISIVQRAHDTEGGSPEYNPGKMSGTIIDESTILTNLHGIQTVMNPNGWVDVDKLYIYDSKGSKLQVTGVDEHPNKDLSLIHFIPTNETENLGKVKMSSDTSGELISIGITKGAEEGEQLGFSYDYFSGTTKDIFSIIRNRNNTDIVMPGLSEPGDSGGALYNNRGELVGVLGAVNCYYKTTRAINISEIDNF